jgi:ubiquinone/menaquinone biosynthesis C-methylase UbiE
LTPPRVAVVARYAALIVVMASAAMSVHADESKRVAPYAATEDAVTEAMLDLAQVRAGDHVVDLGSGDGRIVIAAARRGATGLGVDIDARLVELSRRNAVHEGLEARVRFEQQDLFETDVRSASVVTLYLFPSIMRRVADKLAALAPGTRVVSHDFPLPGWRIAAVDTVDAPGKRDHMGTSTAKLYLYVVPAARGGPAP